ncbi:MAG TPA: potassium-transporting ATPase subunit KdpA, partial [Candidatus Anoxymicrobiaceae bacterium]
MASDAVTQSIIYILALVALAIPLGLYMAKVFSGEKTFLDRLLRPIERGIYRVAHVHEDREMNWKQYAIALILFNLVGLIFLYVLLRLQGHL